MVQAVASCAGKITLVGVSGGRFTLERRFSEPSTLPNKMIDDFKYSDDAFLLAVYYA